MDAVIRAEATELGDANQPTMHVFGPGEETGVPGGNPRGTGRTCKLHTHKSEAGSLNLYYSGLPHPKGMVAEKLPDWLLKYTEKISLLGAFAGKTANHVLVNEYKPGEGIMPHEDGPLYHPTVTTITLASHTLLDFYRPVYQNQTEIPQTEESRYMLTLLAQRQSLLILQDDMYKSYLHGIKGVYEDILSEHVVNLSSAGAQVGDTLSRSTRVSLTIRHVPKVIRANLFLGKK
ncbi:alpha-ketoglutarate-dependent dioxygenase alkB homolog 6 isoform X3 [Triplophysa dalaica]|uniref:alpha-ketoglutarate-dependent dioxygenase alkB homolog 6 isoform X3 n=1 Tax=Triplophysa dalaica TaxID=1582913 RepID=UPI0024DF9BEE|nr:alpha-ketoglutarate-dependent dioxygenase alkB homolog 6 isoform X3 [Triplophysa dalaica]